jgi:hypothetical protein
LLATIVAKKRTLKASKKKGKTLSLILVNDLTTIHLKKRWNDTIRATKKQSDLDSNGKCATV